MSKKQYFSEKLRIIYNIITIGKSRKDQLAPRGFPINYLNDENKPLFRLIIFINL